MLEYAFIPLFSNFKFLLKHFIERNQLINLSELY